MDKLKKARTPGRATITRLHTEISQLVAGTPFNKKSALLSLAKLEDKTREVAELDKQYLTALLNDPNSNDDAYDTEAQLVDDYKEKLLECRLLVEEVLSIQDVQNNFDGRSEHGSNNAAGGRKFRLPKLEIQKFSGELKDWLCFWSLFKKIHEDENLDSEDKFQYLIQSIQPGTRAREMVESYPPTADNYIKAIESIKARFGRDDLLVEVYVRELLTLVLNKTVNTNKKVTISQLFDKLECHMRALDTLGVTSDKCASLLFPLVESCLPEEVLRAWQRSGSQGSSTTAADRLTALMEFLRSEVEGEERISLARAGFGLKSDASINQSKKKENSQDIPTAAGLFTGDSKFNTAKQVICIFCDKPHASADCYKAQQMTLEERRTVVQKKNGCYACLRVGHRAKDCRTSSKLKSSKCSRKHVVLMCPGTSSNSDGTSDNKENTNSTSTVQGMANVTCSHAVGLQTLIVQVHGKKEKHFVRAIVDTASQRSYILQRTAAAAELKPTGQEKLIHALFGGTRSSQQSHNKYEVTISHPRTSFKIIIEMLDQIQICQEIPRVQNGQWFDELTKEKVWISDYGPENPEIEILLGADVAGKLFTGNIRQLQSGLTAMETKLGWTLMGKVPGSYHANNSSMLVTTLFSSLDSSIADLWKLESIGITDSGESKSRAVLEEAAKRHFLQTVKVNHAGRYEVHLPWIDGHPPVPSNKTTAEKRLLSTTKKLVADGNYESYQKVFEEWLDEEVIEKVPELEVHAINNVHYIPHRAVVKETSTTTKIRPVFDASSKVKPGPSLNDCLEKGPNMIEEIPSTVIKFRLGRIGVVSDIRKAFLQVAINKKDCDFLRFLWWKDIQQKEVVVYRHRRAVFGATCSPFLLAAVLEYHLAQASPHLKKTAEKLLQSFYVDNCVTSVENSEELKLFVQQSQDLMSAGKFDLRGWESTWTKENEGEKEETQLLGMFWNKKEDSIYCDLRSLPSISSGGITKRKILSLAHKVYDTIGFTCPVMLFPKILLQKTWKLKLGWDAELPSEIQVEFLRWSTDLDRLSEIHITRWLQGSRHPDEEWELHTFCDACGMAYAACVFLRIKKHSGVTVHLVQAKSRVAPLEKMTIPRLELLSCLIGCRLTESVKKFLPPQVPTYYWTDSSTALHWIHNDDQWATFVGNRVQEIRSLSSKEQWKHLPGLSNPADLPSRGCSVRQLIQSKWWEGPVWLKSPQNGWPRSSVNADVVQVNQEKKKSVVSMLSAKLDHRWYGSYFSNYDKIINLISWMLRFIHNSQKLTVCISGDLQVNERQSAERKLWAIVQQEVFTSESDDKLKSMSVFKDEEGLLRVNTSIKMRYEINNFKFPILLPAVHPTVQAMIRDEHLKNSHAGVQTLLTMLRENYWIIRGRKTVKSVIFKCQQCKRFEAKNLQTVPVALPANRVRDAQVFEVVGVDLAGPLFLKEGKKAWIVLFTCAVYRAVHLELVSSLSTECFLLALRRFISRRGRPVVVYSDNGTNFVGSENLFHKVNWQLVASYSTARRIQWIFNPPSAAWWGGWWERIVRMIKTILRRVLGKSSLSYEDLSTVLCDAEAVINNRPLTYVSEDPCDLYPLTPLAFLQERQESGVPDLDQINTTSLNRKFKHRQQLMDQVRKRFRSEYLSQLILKPESKKEIREINVGDIVLVGSDNTKRLDWPLAKVLELIPGKDNVTRVVRLKTQSGEYLRPIQRVYPLEVSSPSDPVKNLEPMEPLEVPTSSQDEATPQSKEVSPQKVLRTKSGREIKVPKRFCSMFSAFIDV